VSLGTQRLQLVDSLFSTKQAGAFLNCIASHGRQWWAEVFGFQPQVNMSSRLGVTGNAQIGMPGLFLNGQHPTPSRLSIKGGDK